MYKRITNPMTAQEMLRTPGFLSINFSGNMAVIKTRPGYASSIAYNIDNSDFQGILGTIAGDDTIFIVIRQGATQKDILKGLKKIISNMDQEG
jgi:transcriptional regulator of arginine metabolism